MSIVFFCFFGKVLEVFRKFRVFLVMGFMFLDDFGFVFIYLCRFFTFAFCYIGCKINLFFNFFNKLIEILWIVREWSLLRYLGVFIVYCRYLFSNNIFFWRGSERLIFENVYFWFYRFRVGISFFM